MPRRPALWTSSSTSSKWYAGSSGSLAFAGRVGAMLDQYAVVRMIDAPVVFAASRLTTLSSRRGEPIGRQLPVPELAALVLGDGAQHRRRAGDDALLLCLGQRR